MSAPRPEDSAPARAAIVFVVIALLALIWPIYPLFGSIAPRVLGLPFSMFYLAIMVGVVFVVMFALFVWEDRNDRLG